MLESTPPAQNLAFPADFVWGAATASYQIEGATTEDGRGESIWDRFSHTPGAIANGDTGDVACDHYHRWREDVALLSELNLSAYRFSIAWPRIFPEGRGRIEPLGIAFYDRLVDELLGAGIAPWVTLYHWDLPQVLEEQGGWTNRATANAFAEFVDAVTRRLGDRVHDWITLNEPWCSAFLGYQTGEHAPGRRSWPDALRATHSLMLAHGVAVPVIRRNSPDARVGITLNLAAVYPDTDSDEDRAAAYRYDGFFNRWFLDPLYGRGYPADIRQLYGSAFEEPDPSDLATIAAPTDFFGINYYSPSYVRADASEAPLGLRVVDRPQLPQTQMGWAIYPQGLRDVLAGTAERYPTGPLFVTENGAAYPDPAPVNGRVADPERQRYLAEHLAACQNAIQDGIPLKGYFAWSLLDNFEWAFGYTRRFGITYVDFLKQNRTIKDSGRWYGQLVRENRSARTRA